MNEICKLVDDILDTYSTITDKWCEYREKEGIARFSFESTEDPFTHPFGLNMSIFCDF